jgi:hypothetical protein
LILRKFAICECVQSLRHGKICLSYHHEIRALNRPDGVCGMTFVWREKVTLRLPFAVL